MFGKVASDILGLSDVGSVIKPENYDKVDADDYVMHEDNEKIYFLIKSKSDEYCFTNNALIHLDGTSATSKNGCCIVIVMQPIELLMSCWKLRALWIWMWK